MACSSLLTYIFLRCEFFISLRANAQFLVKLRAHKRLPITLIETVCVNITFDCCRCRSSRTVGSGKKYLQLRGIWNGVAPQLHLCHIWRLERSPCVLSVNHILPKLPSWTKSTSHSYDRLVRWWPVPGITRYISAIITWQARAVVHQVDRCDDKFLPWVAGR